jgi:NTE family protein
MWVAAASAITRVRYRIRWWSDAPGGWSSLPDVPPFSAPDVLVLAGGGVLGEAWMTGVLGGIEDAAGVDLTRTEALVGTSAGSIVVARLASGRSPRRPETGVDDGAGAAEAGEDGRARGPAVRGALRAAGAIAWAGTAPAASAALALGAPGGALVRAAVLARMPSGRRSLDRLREHVRGWDARFDGRLRVCAVDRRTGRRVVFGAPGAPPADVADAVVASCSVPWVFEPVEIGGREYVDGGVWSVTNLDAAPAGRDTQVLCLDTIAGLDPRTRRMAALRGAFRIAAELETQWLRRRGARVRHVAPDAEAADAIGPSLMDQRGAQRVLAAGYRQGRALASG